MRVTNWLAGWLDYVFAMLIVAGRWFRVPSIRSAANDPVMHTAFAPNLETYAPRWHDQQDEGRSGALVKAAEIAMLSVSFFLAAHLLSGGTSTALAPNLNRFGLTSDRARADTFAVPTTAVEVIVPASTFATDLPATTTDEAQTPPPVQAAVLAPASDGAATAAGAGVETVVEQAAPPPPPKPAATPAAASVATQPAPPPPPAFVPQSRVLTEAEVRAAATQAGWPAELLSDVVTVAYCESHFATDAMFLGARGLMQILPNWFEDGSDWSDPVVNLRAALVAYREHERAFGDGWSAWTCSSSLVR
jgi:hypothetical protein